MGESEMSLLRKELAKVVAENRNMQKKISEIKEELVKKNTHLELEIDRLNLEIAARDRLLDGRYENSDAPSSTNSRYNAERAAYRKKNGREDYGDEMGRDDGDGDEGKTPTRRGPPAGHKGASHKNRAEKTVTLRVCKCPNCGSRRLAQLPPRVKTVCDFAGDGSMRIACVAYVVEMALVNSGDQITKVYPSPKPGANPRGGTGGTGRYSPLMRPLDLSWHEDCHVCGPSVALCHAADGVCYHAADSHGQRERVFAQL